MNRVSAEEVLVASDGSCLKNPGGATGWAWVAQDGRWASACQPSGTNQVAELWGVLSVLRDFPTDPLAIQVDSEYAMKIATAWARAWAKNGWRTRDGKDVANLALAKTIYSLMLGRDKRQVPTRFIKVPGHDRQNRYPLNTAADERAGAAARYAREHHRAHTFTGAAPPARAGLIVRSTQTAPTMCGSCDRPIWAGLCGCSA